MKRRKKKISNDIDEKRLLNVIYKNQSYEDTFIFFYALSNEILSFCFKREKKKKKV